jgi:hypothetical protein
MNWYGAEMPNSPIAKPVADNADHDPPPPARHGLGCWVHATAEANEFPAPGKRPDSLG